MMHKYSFNMICIVKSLDDTRSGGRSGVSLLSKLYGDDQHERSNSLSSQSEMYKIVTLSQSKMSET